MIVDLDRLYRTGEVEGANGKLEHRLDTTREVIDLSNTLKPKVIVETGTQHNDLLHAHGMSTSILGALARKHDGMVYTVDLDPESINVCKNLTTEYSSNIEYICSDSVKFLSQFDKQIDILYLDSYDFVDGYEEESRLHQLEEIKVAMSLLRKGSIILLDDCNVQMWFNRKLDDKDIQGKSYYTHEYLINNGAMCVFDFPYYQRLYIV